MPNEMEKFGGFGAFTGTAIAKEFGNLGLVWSHRARSYIVSARPESTLHLLEFFRCAWFAR
jgi:hypothetical protein